MRETLSQDKDKKQNKDVEEKGRQADTHEADSIKLLRSGKLVAPPQPGDNGIWPQGGNTGSILRKIDWNQDANLPLGTRAVKNMQKRYGNRYVQRLAEYGTNREEEGGPGGLLLEPSGRTYNLIESARGKGERLEGNTRQLMESGFKRDFGDVRVHTDTHAQGLSKDLGARAFTAGKDIFFGQGGYKPGTKEGESLIAHELTHVVQQGESAPPANGSRTPSGFNVSSPKDRAEQEAESVSNSILSGSPLSYISPLSLQGGASRQVIIHRQEAAGAGTPPPGGAGGGAGAVPGGAAAGAGPPVELKGKPVFEPATPLEGKGMVPVKFGNMAKGDIEVQKRGDKYSAKPQPIQLIHPLFSRIGEAGLGLDPKLVVEIKSSKVSGYIGLIKGGTVPKSATQIVGILKGNPEILGLTGIDLSKLPTVKNKLAEGALEFGAENIQVQVGGAFSGTLSIGFLDEAITFAANANIRVGGLADGTLELKRDKQGLITGDADIDISLSEKYSGKVHLVWNGYYVTGEGKISYTSEKLSGNVIIKLMDRSEAQGLEKSAADGDKSVVDQAKKPKTEAAQAAAAKGPGGPKIKPDYVVAGSGDLTFSFTDWLTGSASVYIDPKGYVTIVGEITPQAEVILFEQKDFIKELPKLEARAAYGIPVIGNVFLFANVGLKLWAKMGPGKLYAIKVSGTYSTDPQKRNDFRIQASLNISAGAGITLRGEGGVGLTILKHDLKLGAGVNGTLGIKGYVEATPIIGYREVGAGDQDKKGEFFLRGELEMAAQPFLGLSGDLFIEIDAPWWSPCPDKKWTWPLFDKEWPLPGSFGVKASVDYVVGSKEWPKIEFGKVDFSPQKFMTDLVNDHTKSKSGPAGEERGKWKEKNSQQAPVPPKGQGQGSGVKEGSPQEAPAKSPVKPGGPKKEKKGEEPPPEFASKGKTAKDRAKEDDKMDAKKKAAEKEAENKGPKKGAGKQEQQKDEKKKEEEGRKERLDKVRSVLKQALSYAEKTGIELDELNRILKSIRKQKQYGLKGLKAEDGKEKWIIIAEMSPGEEVGSVKKKEEAGKGTSKKDPFEITWPKRRLTAYEEIYLMRDDVAGGKLYSQADMAKKYQEPENLKKTGKDKEVDIFSPAGRKKVFDSGETIGVTAEWATKVNKIYENAPYTRKEQGGRTNFDKLLKKHGYDRKQGPKGEETDHDHVSELQMVGIDGDNPEFKNLWPLNFSENRGAGSTLSQTEVEIEKDKKKKIRELEKGKYFFKIKDFKK